MSLSCRHENRHIYRVLGIWTTSKHNELIKIGEKLSSLHFKSLGMAHELHKACIFLATPTYTLIIQSSLLHVGSCVLLDSSFCGMFFISNCMKTMVVRRTTIPNSPFHWILNSDVHIQLSRPICRLEATCRQSNSLYTYLVLDRLRRWRGSWWTGLPRNVWNNWQKASTHVHTHGCCKKKDTHTHTHTHLTATQGHFLVEWMAIFAPWVHTIVSNIGIERQKTKCKERKRPPATV